jgi:hypothetical protein
MLDSFRRRQASSRRLLALAALIACGALLAVASAVAGSFSISTPPTLVSGPSPFAACTVAGPAQGGTNTLNAEVEPFVAVNPAAPHNLIGVYQQDRWSNGGARGLFASRSSDGVSWASNFAAFSACSGGTGDGAYDRASDPWVTFDPDGNAYQISLSVSADLLTSAILVSKSSNGGVSWGAPTTLIRDTSPINFNDKESITADPTRSGNVYAVWDRGALPGENRSFNSVFHSFAFRGQPMFSRTTDGGATWSTPVSMTNQNIFTIGNQIGVLPDGTLIDVFWAGRGSGLQPSPNQTFEGAMISTDAGLHWSPPITIANFSPMPGCGPEDVCDPDTQQPVRAGTTIPDLAIDPSNGTIYVVWADGRFSGGSHPDVVLSKSTDAGKRWSTPVKVNQTTPDAAAFTPSVAVADDGTVGVSYYDFRDNTPATGVPTDVWLTHSHDGGATWTEQQIGGPFDMEKAPIARGFFVGDYEGLTGVGDGFLAFFAMTTNDTSNPTDIFAVRATVP